MSCVSVQTLVWNVPGAHTPHELQVATLDWLILAENVEAGHGIAAETPDGQNPPEEQTVGVDTPATHILPAVHTLGTVDLAGQNRVAGHTDLVAGEPQ